MVAPGVQEVDMGQGWPHKFWPGHLERGAAVQ